MKVQNSAIDLYGDFKLEQSKTIKESLIIWSNGRSTEASSEKNESNGTQLLIDSVKLSEEALKQMAQTGAGKPAQTSAGKAKEAAASDKTMFALSPEDKELIALLERFIFVLTGQKVKISVPGKPVSADSVDSTPQNAPSSADSSGMQGWGLSYHYEEIYTEQESMTFSAQGNIETEDGRKIALRLDLTLSRQYSSHKTLDIKAGDALVDPLVINYGRVSVQLAGEKVLFDLNGDGKKEKISFPELGSGFLAWDKNGDGKINDGRELFGPVSGDGFRELAAQDEDNNGWIDENDAVYHKLSLWVKDEEGRDLLLALSEAGIGAIFLKNVATVFGLKDDANRLNGQIEQMGIFLKENGEAGTIQHIDLAV